MEEETQPPRQLVNRAAAVERPVLPRQPGGWEGQVHIAEDFDDPLPEDLQAAFEGRLT